jgi:aryl-alcohol dehydrogenase-like predicted oxidoreductase
LHVKLPGRRFPPLSRSTPSRETALDVGRLLLNYVLADPYVDVALVGVRKVRLREPRFVELNNEISDDVASRIDLAKLHDRYVH